MNKQFRTRLIESTITLFIGLIATISAVTLIFLIRNFFEPQKASQEKLTTIEETTNDIKNSLTPYETKDKLNKVIVVSNFINSTVDNKPTKTFDYKLLIKGLFNDGYLYVKSSVNNKPLDDKGTVYVKLLNYSSSNNYQELGGHLIASKSIATPKNKDHTELLYPLSDIKYKKDFQNSDIEVTSADWLQVFNTSGDHNILGFNATTEEGKIIELSIYYECVVGSTCSIELVQ